MSESYKVEELLESENAPELGGVLAHRTEEGEGYLLISEEFEKLTPIHRADLLADWIHDLNVMYHKVLIEMVPEHLRETNH